VREENLVEVEIRVGSAMTGVGSIGIIKLNNPERRNALSANLVTEFIAAMERLESDQNVSAIIITGEPPAFCAGADLGSLASGVESAQVSDAEREAGLRSIYAAFLRVSNCVIPTIAAVNGPAVGAGMNLALACDIRVAGRSATFDTRFLGLGLHPGGGHIFLLGRAVGWSTAEAMVLFGQVLDAGEAERRGLVWRCMEDEVLLDEALKVAALTVSAPRALLERTKSTLSASKSINEHGEAVDVELAAQSWSLKQPFFAERLAALRARISQRAD
jgi:enoyl-CoA hydratase